MKLDTVTTSRAGGVILTGARELSHRGERVTLKRILHRVSLRWSIKVTTCYFSKLVTSEQDIIRHLLNAAA